MRGLLLDTIARASRVEVGAGAKSETHASHFARAHTPTPDARAMVSSSSARTTPDPLGAIWFFHFGLFNLEF